MNSKCIGFYRALVALIAISFAGPACSETLTTIAAGEASIEIDCKGFLSSLRRGRDGRNYLAAEQPSPLLRVRLDRKLLEPERATWEKAANRVVLYYAGDTVRVALQAVSKPAHATFEVVEVSPDPKLDWVLWGPFSTTIRQTVGEVVGVVRDAEFAIGFQACNPKTQAGIPEGDEGCADQPYAAAITPWGSVLRGFSMDRSRPRKHDVWGRRAPGMPVPAIPGETLIGSKIALFGCPASSALEVIGRIELAEGLPHPVIDGVWSKVSTERGRSYLIVDFSESDIDELLGFVQRAGLMSLYHGNPWKNWGHFEPSPKYFPNGVAGMKACSEKASRLGIRLGGHTLSNFIHPHDPYVTPVPDQRLATTGSSPLASAVDAGQVEIPVTAPEYFAQEDRNEMRTVVVGTELIRYRSVTKTAPWRLLDCQRGAFGTTPASHPAGAAVAKLMDHAYKVFFPNFEMQRELADVLARRLSETGLSHLDFDGHEGCLAPGEGTYGKDVFARDVFEKFSGRNSLINGTSPPVSHYYWHINSYCNWGEPWYGGFRDSMQEYRINNQAFFERNYIPKMLGWYLLRETTCLSDMEWMLARAAGYDAGFALASSSVALRKNTATPQVLDAIREWETARRSGSFSAEQKERMRNPKNEYHLEKLSDKEWNLFAYQDSTEFVHEQQVKQPGEPVSSSWEFNNPNDSQEFQFKLRVLGGSGSVSKPSFEVDHSHSLLIPVELQPGQTLLFEKDGIARVYDAKGSQIKAVTPASAAPKFKAGRNQIDFDCEFQGAPAPKVQVVFKTRNPPVRVTRKP